MLGDAQANRTREKLLQLFVLFDLARRVGQVFLGQFARGRKRVVLINLNILVLRLGYLNRTTAGAPHGLHKLQQHF